MAGSLTLSETGATELADEDKAELLRMIRSTVNRVEDLYRPARAEMKPAHVDTDPVLQGLYGVRDALMVAERSLLGIRRG